MCAHERASLYLWVRVECFGVRAIHIMCVHVYVRVRVSDAQESDCIRACARVYVCATVWLRKEALTAILVCAAERMVAAHCRLSAMLDQNPRRH